MSQNRITRMPALLSAAAGALLLLVLLLAVQGVAWAQDEQPAAEPAAEPAAPAEVAPSAIPPALAALRINEFMASNQTALEDPDDAGQFPDWIEIYNPGASPVDLANKVAVTDEAAGNPTRWPLTRTLVIPANGFIVLYADSEPDQGPNHVDFALSAGGEEIGLFYIGGGAAEQIDRYDFGEQTTNVSEGRTADGGPTWAFFNASTPGASNALNPPTIGAVTRSIAIPQAGNPVVVTAAITDNTAGLVATLLYTSTAGGAEVALPMAAVGGNKYQATLPGQAAGVYVAYRVRAQDSDGNLRESLRSGYQVGYVPPVLVINELVAENFGKVEDQDDPGEYPDWLEIYNPGPAAVQLKGLSLSDNPREPEKYTIDDSITLAVGAFLLVYLDDDPEQSNTVNIHTNFSLDKGGEFIGLWGGRGTALIDGFAFGSQLDNVALGRYPDGTGPRIVLTCTSPKAPNINCVPASYLPVGRAP